MAATSITRSYTELLSSTAAKWVEANFWDNITDEFPLMWFFRGEANKNNVPRNRKGKVVESGGESLRVNVSYKLNTTATPMATYDMISLLPQENATLAQFEWRQIAASVVISEAELLKNQASQSRIASLLDEKVSNAKNAVMDILSQGIFSDGTGTGTKQVTGLQAAVASSGTYGQIARASNTWWNANDDTSIGSFATSGLKYMNSMINDCSFGRQSPDIIVTTQAVYQYYHNNLDNAIRYTNNTKTADGGFEMLNYRGVPVIFDRDCPSGYMYFLNSNNIYWVSMKGADAKMTAFQPATSNGQLAQVALIHLMGNLVCNEPRKLGVLTGLTE